MLLRRCLSVGITLIVAGCASAGPTQADLATAQRAQQATEHFVFEYAPIHSDAIEFLASAAERRWLPITTDLAATGMPKVRVILHTTHAEMAAAVAPFVGAIQTGVTGLVTSAREMHILAPLGQADMPRASTATVHEFAHCVTLHVRPSSGNNPRWLWETIATYEAHQRPDAATVRALLENPPRTLAELNAFDSARIYDIGYLLGEFVVSRAGTAGLRRLLDAGGDTQRAIGLGPEEFIAAWLAWVRQNEA